MERELVELFEVAKKAANAAASDGVSSNGPKVDALKQLKSFSITYDILVSTQHPRVKIQTMAFDLLEIWKKIVIDETTRKKNGTIDNKSLGKLEKTQKEGIAKVEKIDWEETTNVEKLSKEEKHLSNAKKPSQAPNAPSKLTTLMKCNNAAPSKLTTLVKCNNAVSDKVHELLMEALSKVASEVDKDLKDEVSACDPIQIVVSIEYVCLKRCLVKWNLKFNYRSMCKLQQPFLLMVIGSLIEIVEFILDLVIFLFSILCCQTYIHFKKQMHVSLSFSPHAYFVTFFFYWFVAKGCKC
ncbi:hypothetical protein P3X46_028271 [Hevea brasiliensis]|uniref:TFIIS N-terminal domain-containing protein n=1 Tax=Hevea brasiliensis TaxID=3981 RepID=A0ABQ9KPB4_HEVBR|nr:hypothetical protein P3X46_028271 [Hevea brasiliensis]